MLEGAEVLWPEHLDYEQLMEIRLVEGEIPFQLELQNNATPADVYIFDMDAAGSCRVTPTAAWSMCWSWARRSWPTGIRRWGRAGARGTGRAAWWWAAIAPATPNVLDAYLAQDDPPDRQVDGVVELLWRWQPARFGIEANGFQSLLVTDVAEALDRRALAAGVPWRPTLVPVTNLRSKPVRISTLQPWVANKWLWFADHLPAEFYRQFRQFRPLPDSGHDDVPDSCEGAMRVVQGLV
jgi:hypothetical protein